MQTPRLSVLMSVYNSERWLEEALESVLGQSFADFEFIITEDRSTDRSPEILAQYALRDSRIRIVLNETNLGLTRSLNRALATAKGELLARMDADDISLPGRFQTQVEFLDSHPEVGVLGAGVRLIDEAGGTLGERVPPQEDEAVRAELLVKNNALAHSTIMARTRVLREAGGYDESYRYAQDYDLWRRLSKVTRFACIPLPLVEWRSGRANISSAHRAEQLECQFKVSLAGLTELLGDALDSQSYRRFWFALHGQTELLAREDIHRLGPLWDLLGGKARLMPLTLEGISELSYSLLRRGKRAESFALLNVLSDRCGTPVRYVRLLKSFARSVLG